MLQRSPLVTSLPEKLNRPAWYLDFPKWQEMKNAWGGGNGGGASTRFQGGGGGGGGMDRKASKISFDALLDVSYKYSNPPLTFFYNKKCHLSVFEPSPKRDERL